MHEWMNCGFVHSLCALDEVRQILDNWQWNMLADHTLGSVEPVFAIEFEDFLVKEIPEC